MSKYFEKIVLERLNFFSSEQGVPRRRLLQESKINKSIKLQKEYYKINKKNSANITDNVVKKVFHNNSVFKIDDFSISSETNKSMLFKYPINKSYLLNNDISTLSKIDSENSFDNIWKPKFKLNKVISGHQGWVRSIDVNINNDFFVSGGSDKLIKFWDLDTGTLKLTLTGHVAAIRKVLISDRHPFLFSCSEDKTMKCWDLEQNRVVRNYVRHSSGIYSLDIHPLLDIVSTGSRDGTILLWDIRTREPIHMFKQHKAAVSSLFMQSIEPQLVSGSYDRTIITWDIIQGKVKNILTNHKKPIKSLIQHPKFYYFLSAGADCIKVWKGENSIYSKDISGSNSIINSLAIKSEGNKSIVLAGCDNGQLHFWDFNTGIKYDTIQSYVQSGSLEAENAILDCKFDKSETLLITGECDKTIKIWNLSDYETN